MFAHHGTVESANVIMDRDSSRSKGFGFVEMGTDQQARSAISALHGKDFDGRDLTVNEARPREERTGGALVAVAVAVALTEGADSRPPAGLGRQRRPPKQVNGKGPMSGTPIGLFYGMGYRQTQGYG